MSGPGGMILKPNNVANNLTTIGALPMWVKVGVGLPYQGFQTAATSLNVNLFSLPAKALIHRTLIKPLVAFAGASISAVTLSVGISGTVAKYAAAYDVLAAVSGTNQQLSTVEGMESYAVATQITATIVATGANLSALTAGQVDIYCLLSQIG